MTTEFWTNTIWYLLLSTLSLFVFLIAVHKARNRKRTVSFYLALIGAVYYFEAFIMFYFGAYEYYPKIIGCPYYENLFGNFFSQASVCAVALLIAVLNIPFYWSIIFAGFYMIIEELFILIGIYKHIWYQTWMTFAGLILLFWSSKKWYGKIIQDSNNFLHYVSLFWGTFGVFGPPAFLVISLTGLSEFRFTGLGLSLNPSMAVQPQLMNGWGFFIYCMPQSIIIILLVQSKLSRLLKTLIIFGLYIPIYALVKLNAIYIKEGCFMLVASILIIGMYLSTCFINKLLHAE